MGFKDIRAKRIQGNELSNRERRAHLEALKEAETNKWTINKLWETYRENKSNFKGIKSDQNRYDNYIKPFFQNKEPKEITPLEVDKLRITGRHWVNLKLMRRKIPYRR